MTLIILLAACSGGESQPASTPTVEPAPVSQAEATPQPTELVPVKVEAKAGDTRTHVDGATIVYIPEGEFSMGVKDGEDNPIHTVYTDGFWMYSVEVSNSRYDLCVQAGVCAPPDVNINQTYAEPDWGNMPVTGVTHEQAQTYCEWVHGRLPTEAEWEKTARGAEARIYPWGNEDLTCDRANFKDCNHGVGSVIIKPEGKTPLEVLNLAGNVFEWVFDWYADNYYLNSPAENPAGPAEGEQRVLRGGSFLSGAEDLPAYKRFSELPDQPREDLGFRCVVQKDHVDDFAPMCQSAIIYKSTQSDLKCTHDMKVGTPYCKNGTPYVDILIEHNEDQDSDPVFFSKPPAKCFGGFVDDIDNDGQLEEPRTCTGPELSVITFGMKDDSCLTINPTCADGYEVDFEQNTCVYKGGNNQISGCLEGYQFDASAGCCVAAMNLSYPLNCNAFINKFDKKVCTFNNIPGEMAQATLPTCSITDKPTKEPEPEPTEPPVVCDPATGAGCPSLSDIRLKTDIVFVGITEHGLPLYTFRYIGGTAIYQGVMAQDVLEFMPEAVIYMPNGYMAVNYEMLGLTMERIR